MIVVIETLPVFPERFQAVLVDVTQPETDESGSSWTRRVAIHAGRTSGDLSSFFHAIQLPSTVGFCFALHIVVVVSSTSCAYKV